MMGPKHTSSTEEKMRMRHWLLGGIAAISMALSAGARAQAPSADATMKALIEASDNFSRL